MNIFLINLYNGSNSISSFEIDSIAKCITFVSNNVLNGSFDFPSASGEILTTTNNQVITGTKTFTSSLYISKTASSQQDNFVQAVDTTSTSANDTNWRGRILAGAKNKTFLLGVYSYMCGLGAHSWTDATAGTGAAWEDIYLNPDGNKAVYIGGYGWTGASGIIKVQNANADSGNKAYYNKGTISTPSWQEIATTNDLGTQVSYSYSSGTLTITPL